MSLSELIILGVVVAMFTTFVLVLGGANLYLVLSDRREQASQNREQASQNREKGVPHG